MTRPSLPPILLVALLAAGCNRDLVDHAAADGGTGVVTETGDAAAGLDVDATGPDRFPGHELDFSPDREELGPGDTGTASCHVPLDSVRDSCPAQLEIADACEGAAIVNLTYCARGVRGVVRDIDSRRTVGCFYDDAGALTGVRLTDGVPSYCRGSYQLTAGDVCLTYVERYACDVASPPGWADDQGTASSCALHGDELRAAVVQAPVPPSDQGAVVVRGYLPSGLPAGATTYAETHGDPLQLQAIDRLSGCFALAGVVRDTGAGPGRVRFGASGPELSCQAAARFVVVGYHAVQERCVPAWTIDGGWAGAPIDWAGGGYERALLISGTHSGAATVRNVALPAPPEARRFVAQVLPDGTVVWARTTSVAAAAPVQRVAVPGGGVLVVGGGRFERFDDRGRVAVALDLDTDAVIGAAARWDGAVLLLRRRAAMGADPEAIEAELIDRRGASSWTRLIAQGEVDELVVDFAPDEGFAIGTGARGAVRVGEGAAAQDVTGVDRAALVARFDGAGTLAWVSTSTQVGGVPQRARITAVEATGRRGDVLACGVTDSAVRLGEQRWNHPVSGSAFVARFIEGGPLAGVVAPPAVLGLTSSSSVAGVAERVTVSWSVVGSTTQRIDSDPVDQVEVPSVELPASGSAQTVPLIEPVRVVLSAIGPGGRAAAALDIGARTPVPPSRVVVRGLGLLDDLVSDGARVYWADDGAGIRSVALDGSDVRTVLEGVGADVVILHGDRLYWMEPSSLGSVRTDGTDRASLEIGATTGYLVGIEGGHAYWSAIPVSPSARGIWRVPLDGSAAATLVVPGDGQARAAVGSGALVYTRPDGVLTRAALDGSQAVELGSVGEPWALHIAGRTVYLSGSMGGGATPQVGVLWSLDLDQPGAATTLATVPTVGEQQIGVDGARVYWRSGPGLYAIEAAGPRLLAAAPDLGGMALVPGEVVWMRDGLESGGVIASEGIIRATPR